MRDPWTGKESLEEMTGEKEERKKERKKERKRKERTGVSVAVWLAGCCFFCIQPLFALPKKGWAQPRTNRHKPT